MLKKVFFRAGAMGASRSFSAAATPKIRLPKLQAMIGNKWVKGSAEFETVNPATEERVAHVTQSGKAEVDAAVAAAQEAFFGGTYSKLGGYKRGILMNRLADLIEKHKVILSREGRELLFHAHLE
jgi:aldehyde dehydrogenase (NAD+)